MFFKLGQTCISFNLDLSFLKKKKLEKNIRKEVAILLFKKFLTRKMSLIFFLRLKI